jgi:lysophospholipase L1-like esterase
VTTYRVIGRDDGTPSLSDSVLNGVPVGSTVDLTLSASLEAILVNAGLIVSVSGTLTGGDIGFGDSITSGGASSLGGRTTTTPASIMFGNSYFDLASLTANSPILFRRDAGVSGNTTADMLARIQADVIAYKPSRVLFCAGVNDINIAARSNSAIRADYTVILNRLQAAGIEPVLLTIPPSWLGATQRPQFFQHNAWIAETAEARGLQLIDIFSVVTDPTSVAAGGYRITHTTDGVHPNFTGVKAIVAEVVAKLPKSKPAKPYLSVHALDVAQGFPNPVMTTDTNADGTPDSWIGNGGASNTYSLIADPGSPSHGNLFKMNRGDVVTPAGALSGNVSPTPSAGDRLRVAFRIQTSIEAGSGEVNVSMTGASGGTTKLIERLQADVDGIFSADVIASGTAVGFNPVQVTSGLGYVAIGQMTVLNMTTLG